MDRLLPNEEPVASQQVSDALRDAGVDVRAGAKASAVRGESGESGEVTVELEGGDSVSGEELLVAIGRRARTHGIGLETVGIAAERWLEVDDRLRVGGTDWLYAIGDVNGRALLTHMGKYQGRIACDNILGKEVTATADRGFRGSPHRPRGRGCRLHAGRRSPGRDRCPGRRRPHLGHRGASFSRRNMPGPPGSLWTRSGGCRRATSSAPRRRTLHAATSRSPARSR
jgi:hypothetical protein